MPSPRLTTALFGAALLGAATVQAAAQATGASAVELGKRTARSKYTLGRIVSIQELADGRVVEADAKEGIFRIVDLAKGDVTPLGTQGDDSASYRRASSIIKLGDDSLALYDPQGRKMLHISAHGAIGAFVPMPSPVPGHRLGVLLGGDPSGALYFTTPELLDTVAKAYSGIAGISRLPRGATVDQPLLTYRTRAANQKIGEPFMPFIFRDAVAVRSDGLVARIVADTYQVIWSRDGKEVGRTGPLPFDEIPISVAEEQAIKDSSLAQLRSMTSGNRQTMTFNGPGSAGLAGGGIASIGAAGPVMMTAMVGGGSGTMVFVGGGAGAPLPASSAGGAAPAPAGGVPATAGAAGSAPTPVDMKAMIDKMAAEPLATFPAYKPPMPANAQSLVMFDASGMLWIPRERVRGDQIQTYDVIAEGKGLVEKVKIPPGTRLVGFGKGAVYLARAENGDEWLERYAAPRF
ncbi:MAG TPA: hypothetical protein VGL65_01345 [Gemmatimonadales bacterium]|jgi:hypothetical protein